MQVLEIDSRSSGRTTTMPSLQSPVSFYTALFPANMILILSWIRISILSGV